MAGAHVEDAVHLLRGDDPARAAPALPGRRLGLAGQHSEHQHNLQRRRQRAEASFLHCHRIGGDAESYCAGVAPRLR